MRAGLGARIGRAVALVAISAGLGLVPAAARAVESPAPGATASERTVSIVDGARDKCDAAFDPPVLTVPVGTTVVWINNDQTTHTVVSGEGDDPCNMDPLPPSRRVIDANLFQGMTYRKTFDTPGTYVYTCHLPMHHMQGKVVVTP